MALANHLSMSDCNRLLAALNIAMADTAFTIWSGKDDDQMFTLTTSGQPSRTHTSIARARSDGNNARVWGGMHYPSTVEISDAEGKAIAKYVNRNSIQKLEDDDDGIEP